MSLVENGLEIFGFPEKQFHLFSFYIFRHNGSDYNKSRSFEALLRFLTKVSQSSRKNIMEWIELGTEH